MRLKQIVALVLVALTVSCQAWAGQKEEVEQAFSKWRAALATRNPENVVKLYQPDAILLATLAPVPLVSQEARTGYFTKLAANPGLMAVVNEEHLRLLGNKHAVISGLYTFQYEKNGTVVKIPARFSFVFEKSDDGWLIVEHHSSKVPEQQ